MLSGFLSYLPISFHQLKCLVGGSVGNLYSIFNSFYYPPAPLLFTMIQNLLTAAASFHAASWILIISLSRAFYLPPSPFMGSMGTNEDVLLIRMRRGEYELCSLSPPHCASIRLRVPETWRSLGRTIPPLCCFTC